MLIHTRLQNFLVRSAIFVLFNTFVLWRQTRLHINLSLIVDLKKRVARQFNLPQHEVLESWMRSVTVLRNCCAHHSRLWNRYLSNAPQMNASLRGAWVNIDGVDANKVYAIACCIAYWLDSMGYGLDFKNEPKSLLVSYPQVDPAAMGFPENWISEPLWR